MGPLSNSLIWIGHGCSRRQSSVICRIALGLWSRSRDNSRNVARITSRPDTLRHWEHVLEDSRLQKEDAFSGEALTEAERNWLKTSRSAEAAHWNLLSNVSADTLSHG